MRAERAAALRILAWLVLIFATSCTVVPFDAFVGWLGRLGGGLWSEAWVRWIWGAVWLFVVKGWHFTEYAFVAALAERALRRRVPRFERRLGIAFAGAVLFAASDEWHQAFVPGRGGNVRDVCIDAVGALTAVFWLRARRGRSNFTHSERRRSGVGG